jgi:hypothetical protein
LGILGGLVVGLLFSLYAVVIYAISPGTFDRLGISLGATVSLYLLGGVVGGTICGLLLPLTKYRSGATVLGAITALPVYLGAGVLLGGSLSTGVLLAAIVGGAVGYRVWEPPAETDSANADSHRQGSGR